MNRQLDQEPINWLEIYSSIQAAGITDPIFHSRNFSRCPVNQIFAVCDAVKKRDNILANKFSISAAKIGYSLAGSDKLKLEDFLPFPDLIDGSSKPNNGLKKEVAVEFRSLMRTRQIPDKVAIAIMNRFADEIEQLTRDQF